MKRKYPYTWHGESNTSLHNRWDSMVQRCCNPKATPYRNYGARGIGICKEWRESYKAFREWALSAGYSPELHLDRADNNLGYSPENCRWVTTIVSQRNTRNNRALTAFGETKLIVEWIEDNRCVVCRNTLHYRLATGWPVEPALTTAPIANRHDRVRFKLNSAGYW